MSDPTAPSPPPGPGGEARDTARAAAAARLAMRAGQDMARTIPPRAGGDTASLSFAQERLWFFEQLHPGSAVYNVPSAMRIAAPVAAEPLERALQEMVRRHEALRTGFVSDGARPVQRIAAELAMPFATTDLRHLPAEAREAEARAIAAEEAARPFDLDRPPLIRARLVQLGEADHLLLVTLHHIVSDGWSVGVLYRELAALYAAFAEDRPAPLAPLPVQYADFAEWQRGRLTGAALKRLLGFWRQALDGAPAMLALPTDRPRPPVQSYRGGNFSFAIDPVLGAAIRGFAQAEGATPFIVLLAAFKLLLARVTGQDDLVVGTPIANRREVELEGLIGFFVNTLVLRSRVDARGSFRAGVARVRETVLAADAHQDLPFERLVEELQPERSLSHNPLFQVLFALQSDGEAGVAKARPMAQDAFQDGMARFDLALALADNGTGFTATFEFARDLFDDATIARMAGQYRTLLAAAIGDPDGPAMRLPLMSPSERHGLLDAWNGPRHDTPPDGPFPDLFAQIALTQPMRPAVQDDAGTLSYDALFARARGIADALTARGIGAETRVGVYLSSCADLPAAFLGVLAAGAVYVPLDPALPRGRLRALVEDAAPAIVIGRDADWLPQSLPLVAPEALIREAPPLGIGRAPIRADQAAYLIYTSGSTGVPKGVLVPHHGLARVVRNQRALLGVRPDDRVLHFASIGFDASIFDMVLALSSGACLELAPRAALAPGEPLATLLAERGISVATLPPAACAITCEQGLPRLRLLLLAGEAVEPALAARWAEGRRLLNGYGPTEAAIWASTGGYVPGSDSVPIGRPCINLRLYVLDRLGQPVPPGVAGELHIGGQGIARGYLGRPDLTAQRFVPDDLAGEPGARRYRTGDWVRMRGDGELEFLGRIDAQLKVRGFRIEPGEVEAALTAAPGVEDAAVIARGTGAERRIEAHLSGPQVAVEAVRAFLRERLPDHMVPSAFYRHAALPLTSNGKVDRAALATMPPPRDTEDAVAPRSATETAIAAIWAALIESDAVSVTANFFAVGGHSLLATQLVTRLRERFGAEMPLRIVFERPTIAEQAVWIDATTGGGAQPLDAADLDALIGALSQRDSAADAAIDAALRRVSDRTDAMGVNRAQLDAMTAAEKRAMLARLLAETAEPPEAREEPAAPSEARTAPLSFAQERLWFFDQLHPGSALYNMPFAMRIAAPVAAEMLERALQEIVRRHETLRTGFELVLGKPVQRIAPDLAVPFIATDLGHLPAEQREEQARAIAAEEGARPFDLGMPPLIRARLVTLGHADHVLLITLHHIVSDGWSMGILYRELGALYTAFSEGRPSPLEPLPTQYADFAAGQRERLSGETLDRQLGFWRAQLDGAPPVLALPTDRPRPAVQSYRGALHSFTVDAGTTRALKALAQAEGATLFMAIAAAVKLLLARYTGQGDIVVGTPIANRTRREIEGLIGFFVNTLVLRSHVAPEQRFRELLAQVRETTLAAYAHQDLPFERLVEELQPERTLGHNPLFQVMLLFQAGAGGQGDPAPPPDEPVRAPEMLTGTSKFDLTFALADSGATLSAAIEYNTDLFAPETIARMAGHLAELLRAIVADPDLPMARIDMIGAQERARLAAGLARPDCAVAHDVTVDVLVARRAVERPEAPALEFADGRLSYRALDQRANRLARALRARGMGAGSRVGLWLDRSAGLVVAMLAVWRAGGAFVTLDTRNPPERLAAMLADAGVGLVVTSGEAQGLPEGMALLDLDGEAAAIAARSPRALKPLGNPERLAQIIFTSGSTGAPKGVMIEHRQFLWLLAAMAEAGLGPEDRVAQTANPAFDVMAFECWGTLTAGACLVGVTRDELLSPDRLAETLAERRVSVLYQTATLFNQTVAHRPDAYRGARLLLVGGDVVEPAKVRDAMLGSAIAMVMHTYGPTETTVFCSIQTLSEPPAKGAPLSLSPALPNARLYIVDRAGQLAPSGTVGEILIGGDCVGRGYVGRPELTAERFVPDPFGAVPGARLYRSGDLGRVRADGTLEFLGRGDQQVKIRGHRIEPGEIDAALLRHAGVRSAVTLARAHGGGLQLVAYIVPADSAAPPEPDALRRHCKLLLPDYMVPAHILAIAAIPLTANGKLDRAALPMPERIEAAVTNDPPEGETERAVAAIWGRILGVAQIGRRDNFFDIGGHSLLATQVISRLRDELGAELPLRTLFEAPTLVELACALEAARAEPEEERAVPAPAMVALSRDAYRVRRPAGGDR